MTLTNLTKTISYETRARFFWSLVVISAMSFVIYIYAVYATANNVSVRQNLEKQISAISSDLNALEFTYIELKNSVTLELANNYGFKEVRNPLYISRNHSTSLSFNTTNR